MTIRYKSFLLMFFVLNFSFSQTNTLTSSPYSLFGLGTQNESNIGITNSLGGVGTALNSEKELNGLNPASLGSIKLNSFFLDFGFKVIYNSYGDKSYSTKMPSFGFSNISFGLPLDAKSGVSLSLIPFTDVGYFFNGIVENVDGSSESYNSSIIGSGGLNTINLNYGRKINSKLNIGLSSKYLFGTIKQTETITLVKDLVTFDDKNYYGGFNLGLGMQYKLTNKLNLSSVIDFKSTINATRDRLVKKIINGTSTTIEDSNNVAIKDYKIPTEITFGIKYDFKKYFFVGDYKRSFWTSINQQDNIGKYVDSNVFGFGIERFTEVDSYKKRTCRYRIGFNYDDGNLSILNKKIATTSYTAGIGIPFGNNRKSYLNISYSYSSKGVISTILIKENYHTITFNFDFADNWFMKRKYD